jgi:hypothetical protein
MTYKDILKATNEDWESIIKKWSPSKWFGYASAKEWSDEASDHAIITCISYAYGYIKELEHMLNRERGTE